MKLKTLASVKSQTFTNYEYVGVDGCSKTILLRKIKTFDLENNKEAN